MGGNKLLRGLEKDGILSYIDYLLAYLEKSLYEFKHLTPVAVNSEKLRTIFDLALFGTLLVNELDKSKEILKENYSEEIRKLYMVDLEYAETLDKHYKREVDVVMNDKFVRESIGFSLSGTRKTRPFVCSGLSWGLEPSTLHDFLRQFIDKPEIFSLTGLRVSLKDVVFHGQRKKRKAKEKFDFENVNDWITRNEDRILRNIASGHGWKSHTFRAMQRDNVEIGRTSAYKYLEHFRKTKSA